MVILHTHKDTVGMLKMLRIFKFYRKHKGGCWAYTKERGWITYKTLGQYLGYGFDPIMIKYEEYD